MRPTKSTDARSLFPQFDCGKQARVWLATSFRSLTRQIEENRARQDALAVPDPRHAGARACRNGKFEQRTRRDRGHVLGTREKLDDTRCDGLIRNQPRQSGQTADAQTKMERD